LFALVGIAGEDDLDAPDLLVAPAPKQATANSEQSEASPALSPRSRKRAILNPERSAELRSRLLTELETLQTVDDLTLWALRRLPLKNRLSDADAGVLEIAYEGMLASAQTANASLITQADPATNAVPGPINLPESPHPDLINSGSAFEPAVVQLPKTLRRRDKAHLAFVASRPCLVCQRTPSDAHHLKFAQQRALGRKASDEFTVPLCREHHRELHRSGNERSWWSKIGIAPLECAEQLWRISLSRAEGIASPLAQQHPNGQ